MTKFQVCFLLPMVFSLTAFGGQSGGAGGIGKGKLYEFRAGYVGWSCSGTPLASVEPGADNRSQCERMLPICRKYQELVAGFNSAEFIVASDCEGHSGLATYQFTMPVKITPKIVSREPVVGSAEKLFGTAEECQEATRVLNGLNAYKGSPEATTSTVCDANVAKMQIVTAKGQ